jgi:hypothetical protein
MKKKNVMLNGAWIVLVMCGILHAIPEGRKYYDELLAHKQQASQTYSCDLKKSAKNLIQTGRIYYERLIQDMSEAKQTRLESAQEPVVSSVTSPQGRKWYDSMVRHAVLKMSDAKPAEVVCQLEKKQSRETLENDAFRDPKQAVVSPSSLAQVKDINVKSVSVQKVAQNKQETTSLDIQKKMQSKKEGNEKKPCTLSTSEKHAIKQDQKKDVVDVLETCKKSKSEKSTVLASQIKSLSSQDAQGEHTKKDEKLSVLPVQRASKTDDRVCETIKVSTLIDTAPVQEMASVSCEEDVDSCESEDVCDYDIDENSYAYGRSYYQSLLDKAYDRHALLSLAVYVDITHKAFNQKGESTSLAMLGTDGAEIRVSDIFLIARLSNQGKLHIHIPGAVPPNPQFGQSPAEQYLNLLAPMAVRFGVSQRTYNADITGMYKFESECWPNVSCTLGFQLPIKHKEVDVDFVLVGGKLYRGGFVQQATQRETTITQFFKDFESVEDFFIRAILRPKGIAYVPSQRKTGIGDISLFAIVDVAQCCECIDGLQCGVTLVTPTASKTKANTLFEVSLGNGGGVLIDVWSNVLFRSCSDYFNPTFEIGAEFGVNKFSSVQRISQIKMQAQEGPLRDNPTLLVPVFTEYRTDPFVEIDSTVPFLADAATTVRMRQGYKMFVGFGNYFYDLFNTSSRLGIFYDYLRTGKTKIFDVAANFRPGLITDFSKSHAHRIGWNLAFKASSGFEVEIGSQHIIAGKNVAKLNELFATLTAVF